MVERVKHWIKLMIRPGYKADYDKFIKSEQLESIKKNELARLEKWPRYTPTFTTLLGPTFKLVDAASFLFIYNEVFNNEIYKFETKSTCPYILDCGANVGLSVLYFKKKYPDARIVAFEPDENVADVLEHNISSFGVKGIEVVRRGLWNEETTLSFFKEGADGGRIAQLADNSQLVSIKTTRLKPYLTNAIVDFLKIDIEGAETIVLEDCADALDNVKHIFIEYHSFEHQPQTIARVLEIVQNAGFRVHVTAPGLSSPQPFIQRHTYVGMDMQLNIYGFRVED